MAFTITVIHPVCGKYHNVFVTVHAVRIRVTEAQRHSRRAKTNYTSADYAGKWEYHVVNTYPSTEATVVVGEQSAGGRRPFSLARPADGLETPPAGNRSSLRPYNLKHYGVAGTVSRILSPSSSLSSLFLSDAIESLGIACVPGGAARFDTFRTWPYTRIPTRLPPMRTVCFNRWHRYCSLHDLRDYTRALM